MGRRRGYVMAGAIFEDCINTNTYRGERVIKFKEISLPIRNITQLIEASFRGRPIFYGVHSATTHFF